MVLCTRIGEVRASGFTLMELLVVLVLIALLAGVATPMVSKSVHRGRESTLKENLFVMRKAIDDYYADAGEYPTELQLLAEKRYIRKVPVDPMTDKTDTWRVVRVEGENGQGGIIDVHSGSEEKSSNSMPYSEW